MLEARITLYGTSWCSDCRRALRVLDQHQITYQYINIERDDAARRYVEQVNDGNQSVPTIVFPDGSIMVEPSSSALAQKLASLNS
ncbi:MAG: glutathione S-transferase N-terminal domain-containing protein [Kouleothrix sp.]|jgi:mycoredoxin|nr:glutathione S-transferase N-terminal domain-containing protein [Kouleothrix sp.]